MLIIPDILATSSLVLYGAFVKMQVLWVGFAFAFGMHCFGLAMLSSIFFSYTVDSCLLHSGEAMVFMNVCRCLLSFAFAGISPD